MRFLLVNQISFGQRFLPLGVLKIATAIDIELARLEIDGSVVILDPPEATRSKSDFTAFLEVVRREAAHADYVGLSDLSFYTDTATLLRLIVGAIREANPEAVVILGGWGPTLNPRQQQLEVAPDLMIPGVLGEALATLRAALPNLVRYSRQPQRLKKMLANVAGLYIDGASTGTRMPPLEHDPVSWDLAKFGVSSSAYHCPDDRSPTKETLFVPYQFARSACPNYRDAPGCTFCAMAVEAQRVRTADAVPASLGRTDVCAATRELKMLVRAVGDSLINLFIVDDSVTLAGLPAIIESLAASGVRERTWTVSMFVRPASLTESFLDAIDELRGLSGTLKLFVGFEYMVQRLHDLCLTRKKVASFADILSRLACRDGIEVNAGFILTHPAMTPAELDQNIEGILAVDLEWDLRLSLVPFLFPILGRDKGQWGLSVPFVGASALGDELTIGNAIEEITGRPARQRITPFAMGRGALRRAIDIIENHCATLRNAEAKLMSGCRRENRDYLLAFLGVVRDGIAHQLGSAAP